MGVAIVTDPSAAFRLLAPNDTRLLSSSRSSSSAKVCTQSLPPIRCATRVRAPEQKAASGTDVLLRNPRSGRFSRSRTLKRSGKKSSGRKSPVSSTKQTGKLDYDESAVAALEQIYMGSPSFTTVRPREEEITTVSGHEENCLENVGLGSAERLDSAVSLFQSQQLNESVLESIPKFSEEILNSAGENAGRRKNLSTRLSLRRKRLEEVQNDPEARSSFVRQDEFGRNPSNIMWSAPVHELMLQYGGNVNLMAQSWFKLRSELLTPEEEQWLASIMKPFKDLLTLKLSLQKRLSRDATFYEWARAAKIDLHTLRRLIDVGWAARNKLVQLNLRLVLHQARKYHWEGCSLSVSDLCQEGVKGLMIAVDKFDPSKGFKFCTYAVYWIRNSILRAQTRSGYPIRSPFNVAELKLHIKKTSLELLWELGRAPKPEEIMDRVGLDKLRYTMVMRSGRKWVSLHERQRVTDTELIENVKDPTEDVHSKLGGAGDAMLRLGIDDVLDSLKPKESLVLRQRFGLDGKGERSLGEIGRNLRMSREMARKYEARGLLKLKHPTRLAYLRSFLTPLHSSV